MADEHRTDFRVKMEDLRQNQTCTDVVLECEGGVVHAHRCVLIAACPYFAMMFTVDMLEKNTGIVQFTTISRKVIEMIIKYLYVVEIPNLQTDCDLLRELIATSRMMDLGDFLVRCWKESSHGVNVETFAELWAVRVDFDLEEEKGPIERFVKDHISKISENANLEGLSEIQMTKLIEFVDDQEVLCYGGIQCILKWNSSGDEEVAVKLLGKLDLRHMDDRSLHNLLTTYCSNGNNIAIENILTREVVARFQKLSGLKRIIGEVLYPPIITSPGFANMHTACAATALDKIKAAYIQLL